MPYREFKSLYDADRFLDLKFNSKNELQEIVELTSELCAVPAALITQMDEDMRQISRRKKSMKNRSLINMKAC